MEKPNNSSREGEYHSRELLVSSLRFFSGPPPREFACLNEHSASDELVMSWPLMN